MERFSPILSRLGLREFSILGFRPYIITAIVSILSDLRSIIDAMVVFTIAERIDATGVPTNCSEELMKEAFERKKHEREVEGYDEDDNYVDIDDDALTEVFGQDKRSRTRGVSSHISNKQFKQFAVGKALLEQACSSSTELKADVAEMKFNISTMMAMMQQGGFNACTNTQPQGGSNVTANAQPPNGIQTTRTEDDSTFARRSSDVSHPIHSSANLFVNPKVILLGKNGNVVAEGYVVTDNTSGICHGRQVMLGEKKVYVHKVLDESASVYNGPQGEYSIMQDILEGGFLVWLEARLQY